MRIWGLLLALAVAATGIGLWADDQAPVGKRFYVLGEVNKPGDFEFTAGVSVKSALQSAEGLSPRADKHRGVIIRESKEKVQFDPQLILEGKGPDIPLEAGDTVIVLPGTVKVVGKVQKPGSYDYRAEMTALQALAAAGGVAPGGDAEAAYVEREGKSIAVNLSRIDESSPGAAFKMQIGDTLQIPERTVTITGEVRNPGQYTLIPGEKDKLQDAIQMAGGFTPQAQMRKVQVQSVQEGKRPTATFDLTSPQPSQNPVLRRGDTVHVPGVKQRRQIGINDVYQGVLLIYLLTQIFD